MRLLDEHYTATPFYGVRRMTAWLRSQGYGVNPKRVRRLLRTMGLEAIYAKPRLSQPAEGHTIYPYLLRGVRVARVNQVWSTDITYIRLQSGFVYVVAVLDWFSRYVLSWAVSIPMERPVLRAGTGRRPQPGTAGDFQHRPRGAVHESGVHGTAADGGVRIRMDGCGRALDNVFVERWWRTVKYEEVYLRDYESVQDVRQGLGRYFVFYNKVRLHPPWATSRQQRSTGAETAAGNS